MNSKVRRLDDHRVTDHHREYILTLYALTKGQIAECGVRSEDVQAKTLATDDEIGKGP